MTVGYGDLSWYEPGMAPDDPVLDYVLRQSNLGNMDLCQGRVGLMLDQTPMKPSEAMFAGTMAHYLIDEFITLWLDQEDYTHLFEAQFVRDWIVDVAAEKDDLDLRSRFSNEQALMSWIIDGVRMLNTWVEQWLLSRNNAALVEQMVGRENQMFRPLGTVKKPGQGKPIRLWVSGHPDGYTTDLLVDWKTSSKNWSKGKAFGMSQDDVYAAIIEFNEGHEIRAGLFVVCDRSKMKWHEHWTNITEASQEAAMVRAYSHARDLVLSTWSYSPTNSFGIRHWPCKPNFCSAWEICPARKTGDEYDNVNERVERNVWR